MIQRLVAQSSLMFSLEPLSKNRSSLAEEMAAHYYETETVRCLTRPYAVSHMLRAVIFVCPDILMRFIREKLHAKQE
jgi:hypothetical protein